jgi:hypothetical protein
MQLDDAGKNQQALAHSLPVKSALIVNRDLKVIPLRLYEGSMKALSRL